MTGQREETRRRIFGLAGEPQLYDGKDYFTIYDFVGAYRHFSDPEWDGEPVEPEEPKMRQPRSGEDEPEPTALGDDEESPKKRPKFWIKLADGKERAMMATTFWSMDSTPTCE